MQDASTLKKQVGEAALTYVKDGMVLGLGTGSTAEAFIDALALKIQQGLNIKAIPTSLQTKTKCEALNIPLTSLYSDPFIDLTIDGADEIDGQLNLIKGGGGALLHEKIVAASSKELLIIADESKKVEKLGVFPLPIEIIPFGAPATAKQIEEVLLSFDLPADTKPRGSADTLFITDSGHWIVDAHLKKIRNAEALNQALNIIPGVVETGLFVNMTNKALIATSSGIEERQV